MSTLPKVGRSLPMSQTHEALLRASVDRYGKQRCPRCRGLLHPPGENVATGRCWFCTFPRRHP